MPLKAARLRPQTYGIKIITKQKAMIKILSIPK